MSESLQPPRLSLRARLRVRLHRIGRELRAYRAMLADPRTPRLARWLLAGALIYLVTPIDIVPDFVPVIGQLDDLLIVPLLVWLALKLIPEAVQADARRAATGTRQSKD